MALKHWLMALAVALLVGPALPALVDDTSALQALMNAGTLTPVCGTYNVIGLSIGNAVRIDGGGCVTIHVTASAPAFSCSSQSGQIGISGITITGTGANYTGYGTGPSDAGQHGIALTDCSNVTIHDVRGSNLSGNLIDCAAHNSAFNSESALLFDGITGSSNYRVIYTHDYCEYPILSRVVARKNVFGAEIASGNVVLSDFDFVFNSIGLKLSGSAANGNACHGEIANGALNHNTYNLIIQSCGYGEAITNVSAIGGQSGGIDANAVSVYFYNSRLIVWSGGQLGSNIATVAADPAAASTALSGLNLIMNMSVRDDLTNFAVPSIGSGTTLSLKGNITASGAWSANN